MFANCIFKNFNYCLKKGEFLFMLRCADAVPIHKKTKIKQQKEMIKQTIDQ